MKLEAEKRKRRLVARLLNKVVEEKNSRACQMTNGELCYYGVGR